MQLSDYLAKNPKKHLIFDFDETIARIEINWSGWHQGMAEIYQQFNPEAKSHSADAHSRLNRYAKKFGQKLIDQAKKFNEAYEAQMTTGFTPYPELVELIQQQASNYEMSIYSSNSRQTVQKGLAELGIANYFGQIVSRDEVDYIKPDPAGFELIYDPAIPKIDYLMIGNSHADKDMAIASEIDFYLVEYFRPIW